MKRAIIYAKKHADAVRSVENPFADPQDMTDYELRDYIQKIGAGIIENIEESIDPSNSKVSSLEVQACLKKIPGGIIDFALEKKNGASLSHREEALILRWMYDLAQALEIDRETANFYWQKAKANRILEIY